MHPPLLHQMNSFSPSTFSVAGFECSPRLPQSPRWPAEWERHEATWATWPRNPETWPQNLAAARREHASFLKLIADHEPVRLVAGGNARPSAMASLACTSGVELVDLPSNDAWMRDHGATFAIDQADQSLVAVNWTYNAWGEKYPPFDLDQRIGSEMAKLTSANLLCCSLVMEGGGLETDGRGTLLTTESCVLDPVRNEGMTRQRFETLMARVLGIERVVWLPGGNIVGDDTDGHIDQIARFVNSRQVAVTQPTHTKDPNFEVEQNNLRAVTAWAEKGEDPIEVITLPSPGVVELSGIRLPASYCNFYLANDLVLVPAFGVPQDEVAKGLLKDLFPKRQVYSHPSRNLLWGLGSFHCLTQQQPAVDTIRKTHGAKSSIQA